MNLGMDLIAARSECHETCNFATLDRGRMAGPMISSLDLTKPVTAALLVLCRKHREIWFGFFQHARK